ncbi:MAG TPA: HAD-IA family hydrolase [Candidatus Norongarragalinales archaeon]|nr:HAD-IA family hydrolase [Candidatus Norongarragalinales archaeon]
MIKVLLFDFSRTLLFPKDRSYSGDMNPLHASLKARDLNYPFLDHFELNHELLSYLKTLKGRFSLHIFTTGTVQDSPAIRTDLKIFEGIHSAEKLGLSKTDSASYEEIAKKLGVNANEILLIDDKEKNLVAARPTGMQTFLFKSNPGLISKLEQLKP